MMKTLQHTTARVKTRLRWEVRRRITERQLAAPPTVPAVPTGEGVILFYTPEAGVVPHLAAQCILARTLQERGHRVLFTRCFALFPRCPVMDMYVLPYTPPQKTVADVCLHCAASSFSMLKDYGLEAIDLRQFWIPESEARVKAALADAPDDLRDFVFDGIAFGPLCILDLALATKISQFDVVEPPLRVAWLKYIESSLISYLLIDALCQVVPVRRIVHHNDYALLMGGRLAAKKHGATGCSTLHAGHKNVDRRYVMLRAEPGGVVLRRQGAAWPAWRDLPLTPAQVGEGADDLITRFGASGSHLFSPAKTRGTEDLRAELGLPAEKKLLIAYTSSRDEVLASQMSMKALGYDFPELPQPFADQVAWLRALTEFVGSRDEFFLVIRVHPREGLKKRAGVSQHLQELREAFDRPLANTRLVWPDEPVSSYDLAEVADLALVSWSTIGSELARLGVPVLASTHGISPFPQDDFLEWEATPEDYFATLSALTSRPAHWDTFAHAYRWYHLFHLGSSVNLSDLVPNTNFGFLPPFHPPAAAEEIEDVIVGGKDVLDLNFARQQAGQHAGSRAEEQTALRRQVRRFLHFFYTGQDSDGCDSLEVHVSETASEMPPAAEARLLIRGTETVYQAHGLTHRRVSTLCARLGLLYASFGAGLDAEAAG